jgi:methylenetetrahydrofolate dehydrogenase (NADP+)/methenyltetrahydrofolate cyclohydrolase
MAATILDGRVLARELRDELHATAHAFQQQYAIIPRLAVVHVQGDPASRRYAETIRKLCERVGVDFLLAELSGQMKQVELEQTIQRLSHDPSVHGILIEMPLPRHISTHQAVLCLDPQKDVDGVHPLNVGLLAQGKQAMTPNTPAGGMELLRRYGIDLVGKHAAVVGYSDVVGRPMAEMLVAAHATVTICHEYTRALDAVLPQCDIVVVAVGKAGLVHGSMLRSGAVVVDFGINVLADGSLVGDVDFASASEVASAITPVPGGTGPVTNIMLLRNVLTAARLQQEAALHAEQQDS